MPVKKLYKKKVYKKPQKKKNLVKLIQKTVAHTQETKQLRYNWVDTMDTSVATNHASCTKSALLFNPTEGTEMNQRIGNSIQAMYCDINLAFTVNNTYTGSAWGLRILIVRLNKYVNCYVDPNYTPTVDRYSNVYETSAYVDAYPSNYSDLLTQPVNKNAMTVISDKVHYIGHQLVTGKHSIGGCLHLKQRIKVNKKLNYAGLAATVLEQPLYIVMSLCNLDGHTDTNVVGFRGYITSYYKDS